MTRLPTPGSDAGQWGQILNDYLSQAHNADGTLKDAVIAESQLQDSSISEGKLGQDVRDKLNETAPVTSVAGKTGDVTLEKADVTDFAHTHPVSDVTGLQTALDGKQPTGDYATNTALTNGLATKAAVSHTHTASNITSVSIAGGHVLAADGTGGSVWSAPTPVVALTSTEYQDMPVHLPETLYLIKGLSACAYLGDQLVWGTPLPPHPTHAGYILVPGNALFGTSDFYVMKYQAKNDGSGNAVSTPGGTPWVSISQTSAISVSANVDPVGGQYHLITEAEWLTLAHNIISVPSNWSGGVVGSGYVFRGHTDNVPANALAASADDGDGYYGTGQTSGDQRRTLTLSNGEVIWDLSGNVYEWTSGTIAGGQQPGLTGESAYAWKEWNDPNLELGGLDPKALPSYGTPAASGWNAGTNGLGRLYSNRGEAGLRAFLRGGSWDHGTHAGVFALHLHGAPGGAYTSIGFRVARSL